MTLSLIQSIFLLLVGGGVTFVVSLLIGKIQSNKPRITWRKFPELHIKGEALSGLNWLIENTGGKSAKNVHLSFSIPDGSVFKSFEIEPSEAAMVYSIENSISTIKKIIIPTFTQGVSISISSLISGIDENSVNLSIVGEDVVGFEKTGMSYKQIDRRGRLIIKVYTIFYILIIACGIFFIGALLFFFNDVIHFQNAKFVADLYLKENDFAAAIEVYDNFKNNTILPNMVSPTVNYEIAKIYASKCDALNSVFFLEQLKTKSFTKLIKQDKTFNSIKNTPLFLEYMKKLKKS